MQVVDSSAALAAALAMRAEHGARVFGLDGADGSGKSTTAKELHATLGWPVIHVDEFLASDRGSYLAHLDTQALAKRIRESSAPKLVEGVCLLAIAAAVAVKLDLHVYIKRISRTGRWADEEEYGFLGDADLHIAQLEAEYGPFVRALREPSTTAQEPESALSEFCREVIRYHGHYRPVQSADIVYCRAEPAA